MGKTKDIEVSGRRCLVTYVIWDWPLRYECLGALSDQKAEGLNLMLAWRTFLAPLKWVKEEEINILGYVDLFQSWDADVQFLEDALNKDNS